MLKTKNQNKKKEKTRNFYQPKTKNQNLEKRITNQIRYKILVIKLEKKQNY